ncbi:MAG: FGGY family carbohydrate kinase [Sulfolobales archaeon]
MIVSVDVGTSSVKVGLVDHGLRIVRSYVAEVPLISRVSSAAEHDLNTLWELTLSGIREVVKGYESSVEAISLSTYLHGLAVLNSEFGVVFNVMTHLDRRPSNMQKFLDEYGNELYKRTGCPPIFVFPTCKALWLKMQGILKSNHRLCFVKDYLTYKLTGRHVVDYGVASGTGFLNIHSLKWDSLALETSQVSEDMLPELYEGAKVYDYINLREAGISNKVALVLGSFDGALQNIGYGAFGSEAVLNLGSTAVIRTLLHELVIDKNPEARFFTYYAADGYRAVGGASNNGMVVIEWLKKLLNVESLPITKNIACTEGVYALPYLIGERYPFRDPNLALTIIGLHLEHGSNYVTRSVAEGMALTVKTILTALEENEVKVDKVHCAGGGCNNKELVEIFSNVLCKPIVMHLSPRDAVVLGASGTALRALEYVKGLDYLKKELNEQLSHMYPALENCVAYNDCFKTFLRLVKNAREVYNELIKI